MRRRLTVCHSASAARLGESVPLQHGTAQAETQELLSGRIQRRSSTHHRTHVTTYNAHVDLILTRPMDGSNADRITCYHLYIMCACAYSTVHLLQTHLFATKDAHFTHEITLPLTSTCGCSIRRILTEIVTKLFIQY